MQLKFETNSTFFKIFIFLILLTFHSCGLRKADQDLVKSRYASEGYKLVWADEFEKPGSPDPMKWNYENGFVRNGELQWYQKENAFCEGGVLIIEARREQKDNPSFTEGSDDWAKKRKAIEYTSSCLITKGLQSWTYGRFEMKGRIDISSGLWPAFWTLGVNGQWPENGEIDIMEFYKGKILANVASTGSNGQPKWFSATKPVQTMGGKEWAKEFHVWRMDWDKEFISLFVDDVLLNKVELTKLTNENAERINPFMQNHYLLLNLAIGGANGGDATGTKFPNRMEVDYVRVYQK
ncbi:MAG: glycoside hydrolase family 16 protein [Chitinophagaceae bacterium]|nr:MAG: glycoside hydrolase family 16 protein [Chitinophagaceae bacterium]